MMDETASADDSQLEDVETPWDNVEEVSYEFLKTGKSKGDGILLTHDSNFKVITPISILPIIIMFIILVC